MKISTGNITLLVLILIGITVGDNNSSMILDNIYDDILNSFPAAQRSFIDSAFAIVKDQKGKNISPVTGDSLSHKQSSFLPGEHEQKLPELIHQIDTMRNRRLIHFMNNNPEIK